MVIYNIHGLNRLMNIRHTKLQSHLLCICTLFILCYSLPRIYLWILELRSVAIIIAAIHLLNSHARHILLSKVHFAMWPVMLVNVSIFNAQKCSLSVTLNQLQYFSKYNVTSLNSNDHFDIQLGIIAQLGSTQMTGLILYYIHLQHIA